MTALTNALGRLDDVQFVDNTNAQARDAKRQVEQILRDLNRERQAQVDAALILATTLRSYLNGHTEYSTLRIALDDFEKATR